MGNFWCIGRSYAEHALELGNEIPDKPLVFLKASSCLVKQNEPIVIPKAQDQIHHEIEMALLFDSPSSVSHYACALDLTNRKLQGELKDLGHPWTLAKSFPYSAPLGPWVKLESLEAAQNLDIELKVNGETRQKANTSFLIFKLEYLVSYISQNFPVQAGDILLTGTPSGVAAIKNGDSLEACVGSSSAQWSVE